ncbi:MAG: DNA alkylation repair protein [bacterium]|nr:DNA alkylation repair protein [bacterium]
MATSSIKLKNDDRTLAGYLKSLPKGQRDIGEALHALIMKTLPKAEVVIKWGYPWYQVNGQDVAYLMGVANRINLGFPRGAELASDLLEGTGKGMRHIKVAAANEIQTRAFSALLKSAAKLPTSEAKASSKTAKMSELKMPKESASTKRSKALSTHTWTLDALMAEMKKRGTAQAVKIYKRHGMVEPLFGVSFADLYKLQKQIKTDHALAVELWATGNGDARHLATMIADPALFTSKQIDAWVKDQNCTGVCDLTGGLVARTKFAREKADTWIQSKDEWIGRTGWNVICSLALDAKNELPDAYFEGLLKRLEKEIHGAKNFTRHMMNMALISIGGRNAKLRLLAETAATRIGKVHVDHGETSCKTPEAIPYIAKMWARKKK